VNESGYEDAVINFCEGLYAFGYGLTGNQDGAACRAALVLTGHEAEKGCPPRCIGFAIGTLEHLDDTIAMAGLLGGTSARVQAAQASPTKASITSSAGVLAADQSPGKHDRKGKNACKGQGGCKSSDNGCKRKNSCKGQGGCSGKKANSRCCEGVGNFISPAPSSS
jgi:hypothetical protein